MTGGFQRPPLERTPRVVKLFERRRRWPRTSASTLEEGSAGGGSDGNFTAAIGVPTLDGIGAIGDGAHALHEHVEIDALVPRAAVIAGLLSAAGPALVSFGEAGSRPGSDVVARAASATPLPAPVCRSPS